jgi:hypothetical protein
MTSLYGTDPSYDYKQTYNIKDLKGNLPLPVIRKDTLWDALVSNNQCSDFTNLVGGLPEFASIFNCSQADFTVFVPISGIPAMEYYKARQFILLHTLPRTLPYKFLQRTRMMTIDTRLPGTRIMVDNLETVTPRLNGQSQIIGQQIVGNAVIYYIDIPLSLDGNPLSNIS